MKKPKKPMRCAIPKNLTQLQQMVAVVETVKPLLVGKEKQEHIDGLRRINKIAREHLPKEFCDMLDDVLLMAEDVSTDAVS